MTTVITCYEIPPTADRPASVPDATTRQILRAVDPAARFGWIQISEHATPESAATAVHATATGAFGTLSGSYDAFHTNDVAAPPFDTEATASSVMFVNCFSFGPDQFDAAFEVWRRVNAYMVDKPGYRWHRLHRRTHEDAPFGFVNVVGWESVESWEAAHDEGLRALLGSGPPPFTNTPTLCMPVKR